MSIRSGRRRAIRRDVVSEVQRMAVACCWRSAAPFRRATHRGDIFSACRMCAKSERYLHRRRLDFADASALPIAKPRILEALEHRDLKYPAPTNAPTYPLLLPFAVRRRPRCSSSHRKEQLMATTRTPGITIGSDGRRLLDKRYRGIRIGMRVGYHPRSKPSNGCKRNSRESILRLLGRLARARCSRTAPHAIWRSRTIRTASTIRVHGGFLMRHLGSLEPQHIHDATLAPFIAERQAAGVSATSINRSLEVVRTILNRAARSYRDEDGRPLLTVIPPLIT